MLGHLLICVSLGQIISSADSANAIVNGAVGLVPEVGVDMLFLASLESRRKLA